MLLRSLPSLQDLPLSKLRGFGGKLGEQLEALGCTTAGQASAGAGLRECCTSQGRSLGLRLPMLGLSLHGGMR